MKKYKRAVLNPNRPPEKIAIGSSLTKIKVCHLASGDLWAGAEVQVANLCRGLIKNGSVEVSALVLNKGRLARALRIAIPASSEAQLLAHAERYQPATLTAATG